MWGGGGGGGPQPVAKVDTAEKERLESEAAANQKNLQNKRKGPGSTRLTDPVVDLDNSSARKPGRVSLLGGGQYT